MRTNNKKIKTVYVSRMSRENVSTFSSIEKKNFLKREKFMKLYEVREIRC